VGVPDRGSQFSQYDTDVPKYMFGIVYRNIIKPILFLFSADSVHKRALESGYFFGHRAFARWLIRALFSYKSDALKQVIAGIHFENPIGLAAGFDYNADLIQITPALGFGFHTIGTITYGAYDGNPAPMLGRLPKSKSLLVNKGFKNAGIKNVLAKVSREKTTIPLGISIGSTNKRYESFQEVVEEITNAFEAALKVNYFRYYELNISCPNLIHVAHLSRKIDDPDGFTELLDALSGLTIQKPIFIKMHLEKSVDETSVLCEIAVRYPFVKGVILANLAKDRTNPAFHPDEIAEAGKGNFSGKPTETLSNNLVRAVYQRFGKRLAIIGCGGVFNGKDAYEKIRSGASLVQMITGMVYMGPQQVGVINREIDELVRRDGFSSVHDAIGAFHLTGR